MLVLSRKGQEQIRIGDKIVVSVLKVKGNSVQIGIEAPREIAIVRGELPIFPATPAEDESEASECTAAAEDEPAVCEPPSPPLQSYLRLRRRRREVLECAG